MLLLIIQGRKMSYSLSLNTPNATLRLIDNLNLAIDEAKLVQKIMKMSNQKENIETTIGPSPRTRYLGDEIINLQGQLDLIRNRHLAVNEEQNLF
jgi:hypothetical protein